MTDHGHSRRPALEKLTADHRGLREELLEGFASRRAVVEWLQRVSVRTLGELPDRWWDQMGAQFRGLPEDGRERTLLSALLVDEQRERDLGNDDARELRERMYALTLRPAFHQAFRELRSDAGEYLDDDESDSQHTAARQRWTAMRPALDELEGHQQAALSELLGPDGLEDRSAILNWGETLEQATHGELSKEFVARCYREDSTAKVLTGTSTAAKRGRELFAAVHMLPVMNEGVRDLAGRTSEQPDVEKQERKPTTL